MRLLISGSWVRAPRWANWSFCKYPAEDVCPVPQKMGCLPGFIAVVLHPRGCSSVVERMLRMYEAPSSILGISSGLSAARDIFGKKTGSIEQSLLSKIRNASRICVSSLRRGHANLLCIDPILVCVLAEACTKSRVCWPALYTPQTVKRFRHWQLQPLTDVTLNH